MEIILQKIMTEVINTLIGKISEKNSHKKMSEQFLRCTDLLTMQLITIYPSPINVKLSMHLYM